MTIIIHEEDSEKKISREIQKAMRHKKKNEITLDRYFGKVTFNTDGLTYQKNLRDEWK